MTTLQNLLMASLAVLLALSLTVNLILALLWDRSMTRWMRMFSVSSLGIPVASMDPLTKTEFKPVEDKRKRVSIPVPTGAWTGRTNGQ